jgi:DNA-directed RNA polymerase specialized sigma24 family protein
MSAEAQVERFRRLFADTERELLAYALRRVDRTEVAADVVAETFAATPRRASSSRFGWPATVWWPE